MTVELELFFYFILLDLATGGIRSQPGAPRKFLAQRMVKQGVGFPSPWAAVSARNEARRPSQIIRTRARLSRRRRSRG